MIIKNAQIVLKDRVINGYVTINDDKITEIQEGKYLGNDEAYDAKNNILMPGFIDIHIHGCKGIDFMDAKEEDYTTIANALYTEGVTTFLATTLTSDKDSLARVCKTVANVKDSVPALGGIHFEGPYISAKYKGAQNEAFIRDPNFYEFKELYDISNSNVRYISMAPEKDGALEFIQNATALGVTVSAGHTDATFKEVKAAIKCGLTNTTHTHNAMSGHHHRKPGVLSAAFYYDQLYTEFICDGIHVCPDALKMSYKIIGPERFVIITDALKGKHSELDEFDLFGLPCVKSNGAAYLKPLEKGTLAGSLLTMDKGVRNIYEYCKASLVDLAKISSRNAARSLHFYDRGEIKVGYLADFVLLDNSLNVKATFKLGKKVYEND